MFNWLKRRKERTLEEKRERAELLAEGHEAHLERVETMRAGSSESSARPEPPPAPMPVGRDVCMHCTTGYRTAREYANAVCEKTGFVHASPEHLLKTEEFRRRGQ